MGDQIHECPNTSVVVVICVLEADQEETVEAYKEESTCGEEEGRAGVVLLVRDAKMMPDKVKEAAKANFQEKLVNSLQTEWW